MLKKKENVYWKIARVKVSSCEITANAQGKLQAKFDDGRSLSIYLSVQARTSESDKRILPVFINNVNPKIQDKRGLSFFLSVCVCVCV